MSSRLRAVFPLLCATILAGCWESDGFIHDEAFHVSPPPEPSGPLGDRLPVDGRVDLSGLSAPVDIVRDPFGVIHIYAQSHPDVFRAQGYAMARDRAVQVELLRRTALGRTAEILGNVSPQTIDQDIVMRSLGLASVAEQELSLMDPTVRAWVEAFADGVDQHFEKIRVGSAPLPPSGPEFRPSHFEPFRPVDVLAIDKLMQFAMSWSVGREVAASKLVAAVRTAAASEDEGLRRRAGMLPDVLRFAAPRPATTLEDVASGSDLPSWEARNLDFLAGWNALGDTVQPTLDAWARAASGVGSHGRVGSNAWAVSPSRSASGGSLLAVDAHFRLTSPAALWLVHLQITNERGDHGPFAAGAALPGVPGLAYGFHQDLAWAPAASYFDVADLYVERLDESGAGVVFHDAIVPIAVRQESIAVASGSDVLIDVRVVPHHGPIVPVVIDHTVAPLDPKVGALSVRWAGLEPTRDLEASLSLLAAKGVENALSLAGFFPSSVRSYVFADPHDVMYLAPTHIVQRDERSLAWDATTYEGRLPCFALPGDGSAEWVGRRKVGSVPFVRNPASGFVVTANADPVGGTLDNDPSNDVLDDGSKAFLACAFDAGFRQGRIQDRLMESYVPLTLKDAASIQADVRSELAVRLVPPLIEAFDRVEKERAEPGTFPLLSELASSPRFANSQAWVTLLRSWEDQAGFDTLTGVTFADLGLTVDTRETVASRATLLFHAWLVRVIEGVFGDEMDALGLGLEGLAAVSEGLPLRSLIYLIERPPSFLGTFDEDLQDSLLWDDLTTERLECRDDRLVSAWLDAVDWLEYFLGDDRDRWRWGLSHTVRFSPADPSMDVLAIPSTSDVVFRRGFPRPGGLFTVDTGAFDLIQSAAEAPRFDFAEGAALRFAMRFAGNGPEATVALAGGQVADPLRANFRDGAEYWRHNASHGLMYRLEDVVTQSRAREVAWSSKHEATD